MVTTLERITAGYGKGFDAKRKVLLGVNSKLLILKTDGGAAKFQTLEELATGWAAYFSDFLGSTTFQVAKSDAGFNAKVVEASHVMIIDSDNTALNNRLHAINRETTVPAGIEPFWKIRANNTGKKYVP